MAVVRFAGVLLSSLALGLVACSSSVSTDADGEKAERVDVTSAGLTTGLTQLQGFSGFCMNVPSWTAGKGVVLGRCITIAGGLYSSIIQLNPGADGYSTIGGPNLCFDVSDGPTTLGTELKLATCNGSSNQKFYLSRNASSSFSLLRTASGMCIGTAWGTSAEGASLRVWDCTYERSQAWRRMELDGAIDFTTELRVPSQPGQCLDVRGGVNANRTPVQVFQCNGTPAQEFSLTHVDSRRFTLRAMGRCLDVRGGVFSDHTPLQIFDCNGTISQLFHLESSWGPTSLCTENGYCVDRPNNNTANGTTVQIFHRNDSAAQTWTPTVVDATTTCSGINCIAWPLQPFTTAHFAPNVTLKWGCYSGYPQVYRRIGAGPWQRVSSYLAPCTGDYGYFTDSGLTPDPNTIVSYRVQNLAPGYWRVQSWSQQADVVVTAEPAPPSPALAVTDQEFSSISLKITDKSTNEDGFKVYRIDQGQTTPTLVATLPRATLHEPTTGSEIAWTDTTVVSGRDYKYRATAYHAYGESAPVEVTAYASPTPLPVESLYISAYTTSSLTLSWTSVDPNSSNFVITQTSPTVGTPMIETFTSREVTGLQTGTQYCFDVQSAVNAHLSTPVNVCGTPHAN